MKKKKSSIKRSKKSVQKKISKEQIAAFENEGNFIKQAIKKSIGIPQKILAYYKLPKNISKAYSTLSSNIKTQFKKSFSSDKRG